ncbi:MAG: diacylglycerol kinase family lipid kinase [Planctomycetes bacterium]|nr:diacylglycerol kinase family lipid kinase [Planctomycetota bacterium]
MRKTAAIIANPASGRGKGIETARSAAEMLHAQGLEVDLLQTVAAGHARKYANRICNDFDVIVSVGGDGTLNEIVNGIVDAESDTPIAIIPSGTANVVGLELGLPETLEEQVRVARSGPVRSLDLGLAGERRFTMCAGIGFDAKIVDMVSQQRSGDGITMLSYTIPTVQTMLGYKFPKMRVSVDGQLVDEDATFIVIGNMRRYGGPFRLFQKATPDDGKLDLCCLHGDGMGDLLRYSWNAFWNRVPELHDVSYHTGKNVMIEADEEVLVQIDGDSGGKLPMEFKILPGAVNFCVDHLDPHGESSRLKQA